MLTNNLVPNIVLGFNAPEFRLFQVGAELYKIELSFVTTDTPTILNNTKYFANLDLKKYTDNIRFWNILKPMFSNTGNCMVWYLYLTMGTVKL